MIKIHLNELQREFVTKWLDSSSKHPSPAAFAAALEGIARIPVVRKPEPREIPYTAQGDEICPLSGFHAVRDLPPGWALRSRDDADDNHTFHNAGEAMLQALWDCWVTLPDSFGSAITLSKELKANKIKYP